MPAGPAPPSPGTEDLGARAAEEPLVTHSTSIQIEADNDQALGAQLVPDKAAEGKKLAGKSTAAWPWPITTWSLQGAAQVPTWRTLALLLLGRRAFKSWQPPPWQGGQALRPLRGDEGAAPG